MENKKLFVTSLALLAFASIAGVLYALPFNTASADPSRGADPLTRSSESFGSTKIIQFSGTSSNAILSHETTEDDEMLIKTLSVLNGSAPLGTTDGTWGILRDFTSAFPVHAYNVSGNSTEHYHFDPPLPLEAGNFIVFQADSPGGIYFTQIILYGTEPVGSGVIMR